MTGRKRRGLPNVSTKASLVVLFVPSVDRDSKPIDQERWTSAALELLGRPVVIHCYALSAEVEEEHRLAALRDFCLEMCAATNQGEVGLVIDNRYHGLSGGAA